MVKDENYWEEIYKSLLEEYHELETQLGQKEEEVKRLKSQIASVPSETGTIIEAEEETLIRKGNRQFADSPPRDQSRREHPQPPAAVRSPAQAPSADRPEARTVQQPAPTSSLATVRQRLGVKRNFFQRTWSFFFDPILRI
jgi:DNA-binding protein H-NS